MTSPAAARTIAIFDFDATLIKGDSLWPFLAAVAGWPRCLLALALALCVWAARRTKGDARTFIKSRLLMALLAGRRVDSFDRARQKLRGWVVWLEPTLKALREHHAAGHHIVIASGGLDLYLPDLLRDIPHHALICTQMEVKDGCVTGAMLSQNCVRKRKAELVAAYLAAHGPFEESWGYGNLPHDLPMLALVRHRVIV